MKLKTIEINIAPKYKYILNVKCYMEINKARLLWQVGLSLCY